MAGVDILATAFNGANAAFIADLYARWVDESRRRSTRASPSCSSALNDEARSVLTDASGASWAPRHVRLRRAGARRHAGRRRGRRAGGGRAPSRSAPPRIDSLRALMLIRAYRVRGHLEAQARPARPAGAEAASRARPARPTASPKPTCDRPIFIDNVLGRETRDHARDHAIAARELLRPDRRRVHAHPGSRPEGLDPAPDRGRALAARLRRRGRSGPSCSQLTEAEGFEAFCQTPLRRHQAVRAGGRRGHHPRAARDHRDGGAGGRERGRDRHAASRPAQHAGQHRARSRSPRCSASSAAPASSPTTCRARAT